MAEDPTLPTEAAGEDRRLEVSAATCPQSAAPMLGPGVRVASYTITRLLGVGGMGTVYEATQERPHRTVALKLLRPGFATTHHLRRFELEAEVLGRLHHPGIAAIHEAGVAPTPHGEQPFFAMELVEGLPLKRYVERAKLDVRARLELMAHVCDAVHHAHQHGVIHRDLKPSNILVTDEGQPKVLDFGVARATDADIQAATIHTDVGQLLGTVPYMSPEQAGGDPAALDTRSDIYALGVVLYELLAGRLPYDVSHRMVHEAVRAILEDEPAPLSSIDKGLRGDIETIAATALAKDKQRRYASAAAMAADIRRHLHDEPIAAHRPSTWYQLRKFSRRNRVLVAGVAATFVALVAGIGATSWQAVAATRARDEAQTARRRAERAEVDALRRAEETQQVAEFQSEQLAGIDPARMGATIRRAMLDAAPEGRRAELAGALRGVNLTSVALATLRENVFDRSIRAIEAQFADQPLVEAQLLQTIAGALQDVGLLDHAMPPQRRALALRRELLGDDHPDSITSINNLSHLLAELGELEEATRYAREALALSRSVNGEDHVFTLTYLGNLGSLLADQERLDEAEALYREALRRSRRTLGDEHPRTLTAMNDMGVFLRERGDLEAAEPLLRETLDAHRRLLGEDTRRTFMAMTNLGLLLEDQGRFADAETLHREALAGKRRLLGDDHPSTILSISGLGAALQEQGRLDEAQPLAEEALARSRDALGDDHHSTLGCAAWLGLLRERQGRLADAEALYREALEGYRRELGDDHAETVTLLTSLGRLLLELGRTREAEPLLREAVERGRLVLGETHLDTLRALSDLGALLLRTGRPDEAEPFVREALRGRRARLGDAHPYTLTTINNLGALLHAQGRMDEAARYLEEALEIRRRTLGDDHPETLISMMNVSVLQRRLDRLPEADALSDEAVHRARSTLPEGHWHLGAFLVQRGRTLLALERFAEAEIAALEAHTLLETALGPDHPQTATAAALMIDVHGAWHETAPGEGHDAEAARWRAALDAARADAARE